MAARSARKFADRILSGVPLVAAALVLSAGSGTSTPHAVLQCSLTAAREISSPRPADQQVDLTNQIGLGQTRDPGPLVADGKTVWIGERGRIASLDASGDYSEEALRGGSYPDGIALGPGSAVWFTQARDNRIGFLLGGVEHDYSLPANLYPNAIAVSSKGVVWAGGLGGLISWSAVHGFQHLDDADRGILSVAIAADGSVWFAQGGPSISHFTTGGGLVSHISVDGPRAQVVAVAVAPSGAVWYADSAGLKIGEIVFGRSIKRSTWNTTDAPKSLGLGKDGSAWFVEPDNQLVGNISKSGHLREFRLGRSLTDLTVDESQNVWLSGSPNLIAKIQGANQIEYFTVFSEIACQP